VGEGFVMIPRSVLHSSGLSGHAKLIYALLQSHNGPSGCFPSIAMLAEESGWSRPTVMKSVDELVTNGIVEKKRRGQTQVNLYVLKSTSFTSENGQVANSDDALKSTGLKSTGFTSEAQKSTTLTSRSQPALPLKSSTLTAEVNDIDSNYNNLTRITELEVPGTRTTRVPARKPRQQPVPLPVSAIPPALSAFDAVLRETAGYVPTQRFIDHVVTNYAALDLKEEALKMADWLDGHGGRPCSTRFVLNWLKGALADSPRRSTGTTSRNGNGYHNQSYDLTSAKERAAAKRLNVGYDDDEGLDF
jgi:DNA-binding transcriptional regulator YhcF (GntR family)